MVVKNSAGCKCVLFVLSGKAVKMLAMRVSRPAFFRVRSLIDVLLYFVALIACILALIFNFEFI